MRGIIGFIYRRGYSLAEIIDEPQTPGTLSLHLNPFLPQQANRSFFRYVAKYATRLQCAVPATQWPLVLFPIFGKGT